jgi:molecular chaperone DnaK
MVYNVEKMLSEHRAKVSEADVKLVEEALQGAKDAVKEGDLAKIRAANDKLTQSSHKLAEAMYASSSQPGADATAGGR